MVNSPRFPRICLDLLRDLVARPALSPLATSMKWKTTVARCLGAGLHMAWATLSDSLWASMMISLTPSDTGYILALDKKLSRDFVESPRRDRKKIGPRSQEVRRISSAFAKVPKMAKDQYHHSSPGSEPSSGIGTSITSSIEGWVSRGI